VLGRLGQLLYWLACGIAALVVAYGWFGFKYLDVQTALIGSVAPALLAAVIVRLMGWVAFYLTHR
jgi:hypothetical protein